MLNKLLTNLSSEIIKGDTDTQITYQDLSSIKDQCVVILPAGGLGSRLAPITQGSNAHKTSYRLPDGRTMIERVIEMYRDAGITSFVALIYHHGEDIVELLGDGSKLGVNIRYSTDPDRPVGRGGAIFHALQQDIIPKDKYLIVHNPDDQIVQDAQTFVDEILRAHLVGEQKSAIATVVVANGSPYPYTGMAIDNQQVVSIEMYPFVPIPLHIGVTVFSPQITKYFLKMFNVKEKVDFESVLFPVLADEGKLFAKVIPYQVHIAVNDPKNYKRFLEAISSSTL